MSNTDFDFDAMPGDAAQTNSQAPPAAASPAPAASEAPAPEPNAPKKRGPKPGSKRGPRGPRRNAPAADPAIAEAAQSVMGTKHATGAVQNNADLHPAIIFIRNMMKLSEGDRAGVLAALNQVFGS